MIPVCKMTMADINFQFEPAAGLRSGHVQSLLSSSMFRKKVASKRAATVIEAAEELQLDGGPDEEFADFEDGQYARVRLQALYSRHEQGPQPRRTAVLFHGWEGSAQSNYVLGNAARLWSEGFDVLRFNFRDHGETHHLNPGMFHSCRLDEVMNALQDWQQRFEVRDWNLCGYSLGGNFALRVAKRAPEAGLDIRSVVSVCPVIHPARAMRAMEESGWIYKRYFERKWARSLRKKIELFPALYGGETMDRIPGLNARTDYMARKYSGFESAEHYYDGYAVSAERLDGLEMPVRVLTAKDDPVIPVADFPQLRGLPNLDLNIAAHGGHCGFLRNWQFESAAEDFIVESWSG